MANTFSNIVSGASGLIAGGPMLAKNLLRRNTNPKGANALTGQAYYENLAKTGAPKEQSGAMKILQRQFPTSGLLKKPTTPVTQTGTTPTSTPTIPTSTPTATPVTPQPAVGSPAYQAGQYGQTGQLTPYEKAAYQNVQNAAGMQNFGQFAPNAEAQFYAGLNPQNPEDRAKLQGLITRPDLVGRAGAESDLYNKFANLYGTQANVGLQAAQTAAQRAANVQGNIFQASLPQAYGYGTNVVTPLNMQSFGAGAAGQGGAFQGGLQGGLQELGGQYAQNFSAHQQAQGIKNTITGLLTQSPLNPSDFTSVNQFIQLLSGQVGDPKYQSLSNYLNEYISTLAPILGVGGDTTNLKTQIAQSMINAQASGGSITSVLNDLDALAQTKLNQAYQAGQGGFTGGGSFTGGTGSYAEVW